MLIGEGKEGKKIRKMGQGPIEQEKAACPIKIKVRSC
jgi:hypothetical protein